MKGKLFVVFVHGWSVTNTRTYGRFPERLKNEAARRGLSLRIEHIFLGKYISFHDEIRISDISRAFEHAVRTQLRELLAAGERFVCITHSTGGPVVRNWFHRYYTSDLEKTTCPMSHLIMLAPANFGSALAQLGKSRLSRIKSWFDGIEPGQGVLDWLELGSREAWKLNKDWIANGYDLIEPRKMFPFVLTGQSIDRHLYDHLNSYTGEPGSDGVVRCASANMSGRFVKLVQKPPETSGTKMTALTLGKFLEAPAVPFRIIQGKSHSGKKMGILQSVREDVDDGGSSQTIEAVFRCIAVKTIDDYRRLATAFENETRTVQAAERIEIEKRLMNNYTFIKDRYAMVIFRVVDSENHPVTDYDILLTAGRRSSPNHLPRNFLADRQRNKATPEFLTLYFNYDIMMGSDAVKDAKGRVIRDATPGAGSLGITVYPRPDKGFVHYHPCKIGASPEILHRILKPNSTTLVEIRLARIVHENVFRLEKVQPGRKPESFKKTKPGNILKPDIRKN